jgi:hypothetical protein
MLPSACQSNILDEFRELSRPTRVVAGTCDPEGLLFFFVCVSAPSAAPAAEVMSEALSCLDVSALSGPKQFLINFLIMHACVPLVLPGNVFPIMAEMCLQFWKKLS